MTMLPAIRTTSDLVLQEEVDHLTLEEFHKLLGAADKKFDSLQRSSVRNLFIRDRNKMLLIILWATAGRISDVLAMREDDIDYDKKTIKFYVKKRKLWHTISIDSDVTLKLSNYVRTWHIKGLLFQNVNRKKNEAQKPMARQTVDAILKDYAKIAGVRPIHAHLFRHGCAMYMLSKGVPMEIIAYRLKHSTTRTTAAFYARINPDIERALISNCVPDILGMG